MRARLKTLADLLVIPRLFISYRLSVLLSHTPGGFLANHTDHFYYFSFGRLSHHGYYPFADFYLTARQIWDNSTSWTVRWICSWLLVPICFWWGWFDVPETFPGLHSLVPCFKPFPQWTPE